MLSHVKKRGDSSVTFLQSIWEKPDESAKPPLNLLKRIGKNNQTPYLYFWNQENPGWNENPNINSGSKTHKPGAERLKLRSPWLLTTTSFVFTDNHVTS